MTDSVNAPAAGDSTPRPDRVILFADLVVCFDRNFPGDDLITAILQAGGHVIARVKEGISLPFDGPDRGWLPDGSRMTWLNAPSGKKQDRLPVRAAGHNVILPSGGGTGEASETCTIITTLLDHETAPAGQVRDTCLTRWSASETSKPHCCHMHGSLALPSVPSGSVLVKAA